MILEHTCKNCYWYSATRLVPAFGGICNYPMPAMPFWVGKFKLSKFAAVVDEDGVTCTTWEAVR